MELNKVVFPKPRPSYTHESLAGKILYVPKFEIYQRNMSRELQREKQREHVISLRSNKFESQPTKENNGAFPSFQSARNQPFTQLNGEKEVDIFMMDQNEIAKSFKTRSNSSNVRMPYQFMPKNGAPSVKGKIMTQFGDKIRTRCSLTRQYEKYNSVNFDDKLVSNPFIDSYRKSSTQAFDTNNSDGPFNLNIKEISTKSKGDFIPCLFLKYAKGSSKIFLYFHANAEDIGKAERILEYIHIYLKVHVISVEYPGYGIYSGSSASADKLIEDAEIVYNFLTKRLLWKEKDIIVCGRSIGSGPACYLGSNFSPASLCLISPHTSIRGIVKDQFLGRMTQHLIAERFRNIEAIGKVRCPTFILHGLKDTLVQPQHSQNLCDACGGPSFLLLPKTMDHNSLDIIGDLVAPLSEFLDKFQIDTENNEFKCESRSKLGQHYDQKKFFNKECGKVYDDENCDVLSALSDFDEFPKEQENCKSNESNASIKDDSHSIESENEFSCLDNADSKLSTNRVHPLINLKLNDSEKMRFVYRGPNLVIENLFFEKPEDLIKRAKVQMSEITRQKSLDLKYSELRKNPSSQGLAKKRNTTIKVVQLNLFKNK